MPLTASRQSRTNTASSPFVDTDILLQLDSTLSSKYTLYKNFYLSKQTSYQHIIQNPCSDYKHSLLSRSLTQHLGHTCDQVSSGNYEEGVSIVQAAS